MIINISNNILVLQLQYNFSKLSDLIAAKVIYSHSVVSKSCIGRLKKGDQVIWIDFNTMSNIITDTNVLSYLKNVYKVDGN